MATGNITRLEGVWPETHERAVRDSAGVNLETKLGNINSNISQLDQEVNGSTPPNYESSIATTNNSYLRPGSNYVAIDIEPGTYNVNIDPAGTFAVVGMYFQDAEHNNITVKNKKNSNVTQLGSDTAGTNSPFTIPSKASFLAFNASNKVKDGTITVTLINTAQATAGLRETLVDLKEKTQSSDTGLCSTLSLAEISAIDTAKKFWAAIKSIGYEDPSDNSKMYVRLGGFYTDHIQFTLTKNHSTMVDFVVNNVATRPTGVQTYTITNGNKVFRVVVDWDELTSNFADPSSTYFYIVNTPAFDFTREVQKDLQEQIDDLQEVNAETDYGYINPQTTRTFTEQNIVGSVACPCKVIERSGLLATMWTKSSVNGTAKLFVGVIDQMYLFIPRKTVEIPVVEGEQTIDLTSLGIYVRQGERVAMQYAGKRYLAQVSGTADPESDNSFYYTADGATNPLQLQVFGAQRVVVFSFGYTVLSSEMGDALAKIDALEGEVASLNLAVGILQGAQGIVGDSNGNKYRLIVVNNELQLRALNFSHILAVGNSYTIHPTVQDTGDYANNLWWGHWAMAATAKETAWPSLLQTALRQKDNSAIVTPVFGRRYESGSKSLTDNDTFTYWEDNSWKNLKPNVASFSDVDCVLFFLGDNYTGNDWYQLYKAMVEQFLTWFPSAAIICCSTRSRAANNTAIAQVADEKNLSYISMQSLGYSSKLGGYVLGDDNLLHQINKSSVASHFGDYGQWQILDRIVSALGYVNNAVLHNISITNPVGVTLTVKDPKTLPGAIVSVFADVASGASFTGISVASEGSTVNVTDHGVTDYGRIFTFTMPAGDVTITGA